MAKPQIESHLNILDMIWSAYLLKMLVKNSKSKKLDAERTLSQTYRGEITVGMPKAEVEEGLQDL